MRRTSLTLGALGLAAFVRGAAAVAGGGAGAGGDRPAPRAPKLKRRRPGRCRAPPTATPICRATGPTPRLRRSNVRRASHRCCRRRSSARSRRASPTASSGWPRRAIPNRPAPPQGGDGSTGAAGNVGGYNNFWIDAGERVAIVERRVPHLAHRRSARRPRAGADRRGARAARPRGPSAAAQFGQYDNPENRPLAERCLASFGRNAGPPMLPNYFYNNNYTIVQTTRSRADHDRDGARHPRSSGSASSTNGCRRTCARGGATRSAGGMAIPWSIETTNFHPSAELPRRVRQPAR